MLAFHDDDLVSVSANTIIHPAKQQYKKDPLIGSFDSIPNNKRGGGGSAYDSDLM